ncbi:hypothetical protein WMF38_56815 [Sorangium sp. So ce118]
MRRLSPERELEVLRIFSETESLRETAKRSGVNHRSVKRIVSDIDTCWRLVLIGPMLWLLDIAAKERGDMTSEKKQWSIAGRRYGMLVALGPGPGRTLVSVRCDCGVEKFVGRAALSAGRVTSCGCKRASDLLGGQNRVEVFGREMSLGQLAEASDRGAVAIAARIRRGASAEEAAFGR